MDDRGQVMQEERANILSDFTWQIITDAIDYSKENSEQIASTESLRSFFDEKLIGSDLNAEDRKLVSQMAMTLGSFTGDTWERQSLKNFWLEECLDGGMPYNNLLNHFWSDNA